MPPNRAAGITNGGGVGAGKPAPDEVDEEGSAVFEKSLRAMILPEETTNEEKGGRAVPDAVGGVRVVVAAIITENETFRVRPCARRT